MQNKLLYTLVFNLLLTLTNQMGYNNLSCNISENPNPGSPYIGNYIKLGENNKSCLKACDTF